MIDFGKWFNHSYGDRTPWGEQDSPAVVAAVESALERSLSSAIMGGDDEAEDPDDRRGRGASSARARPARTST